MSNTTPTPISPELALVDPDLAEAARALLPDPPDVLARRPRPPSATSVERTAAQSYAVGPPDSTRRRPLRLATTVFVWVVLAAVMATPLLAFLPPKSAPSVEDSLLVMRPTPKAEKSDPAVAFGSKLRWGAVPGAVVYNVILVRGNQRVDLWSTKPSLGVTIPERPDTRGAPVVTYTWFVYPGFRVSPSEIRYGTVIAQGAIAVRAGTLRLKSSREGLEPVAGFEGRLPGVAER